jgi:hypothetical protein
LATSGWYPDPGGQPGRYRYWDGDGWSAETTDDPADPPPVTGDLRPPRPQRPDRGAGTGFGVAMLVLVIVVVSAVLIIKRTDQAGSVDIDPPESTASGWNDSSPLPSAAARSASAAASPGNGQPECSAGEPDRLFPHPDDGRAHGGRLSMMTVPAYSDPDPEYLLSWMVDTQGVDQATEPGWQSLFAVGEVARTAGFDTPQSAVRSSMICALTNSWYYSVSGRKDIRNESITVDGRPGWILTAEIKDSNPDIEVDGDQLTFLAVDDGRSDALSMWVGMVPLDDRERIALDQKVLADLRVES